MFFWNINELKIIKESTSNYAAGRVNFWKYNWLISVPIKLLRPECNLRKSNVDRMYARSIVIDAHDIETLFGHEQVTFLSCDDKAQWPKIKNFILKINHFMINSIKKLFTYYFSIFLDHLSYMYALAISCQFLTKTWLFNEQVFESDFKKTYIFYISDICSPCILQNNSWFSSAISKWNP